MSQTVAECRGAEVGWTKYAGSRRFLTLQRLKFEFQASSYHPFVA